MTRGDNIGIPPILSRDVQSATPQERDDTGSSDPDREGTLAAVVVLGRSILAPALGAGIAFALLVYVLLPVFGVGSVQRIVALGNHLDDPFGSKSTIAFVGNSITREGIDATDVDAAGESEWTSQNLALSGCGLGEIRVLMPRLLAASPAAVVVGVRPDDLGRVYDFELDKGFAYAMGSFPKNWPNDWTEKDLPSVGPELYAALRSTAFEQDMHFRTAPLRIFNQSVRLRFRKGLRSTASDNWTDPYEMQFSVEGERLADHVHNVVEAMFTSLDGDANAGETLLLTLGNEIADAGATPIFLATPVHPLVAKAAAQDIAQCRVRLQAVSDRTGGIMIDATDILDAAHFADANHPNADGRRVLSYFVGKKLRELKTSP